MELSRELLSHMEELKIVHTGPFSELGCIVGIDAENWISNMLEDDFYSHALGGPHLTISSRLSYQIKKLKERDITPVFFFHGISERSEWPQIKKKLKNSKKLWEESTKKNQNELERILMKSSAFTFETTNEIISTVRKNGGEIFKCPSHTGFQLSYLEKTLGNVAGGLELAMFGISKIIVSFDLEQATFSYVFSSEMMKILGISMKSFISSCVIRGFWLGSKLTKMSMAEIFEKTKANENASLVEDKHSKYIENVSNYIESQIYICSDQQKINFKATPGMNVFQGKMAEEFYFALCFFPMSSDTMTAFVKKTEVLSPPIADSLKYRTLVHKYKPLMKKLYSILNHYFDDAKILRGIKVYYWYEDSLPFQLDFVQLKPNDWDPFLDYIEQRRASSEETVTMQYCISEFLSYHKRSEPAKPAEDPKPHKKLSSDLLKIKLQLQLLEAFGIISQDKPSLFCKILSLVKPEFHKEFFMILELLKLGLLDWKPMTTLYLPESVLKQVPPDTTDFIRIISRVAIFVSPGLTGDLWTGAVEPDLSQFYAMTRYIAKTYQDLGEVFFLEEFVNKSFVLSKELIYAAKDFVSQLPLNNVAAGVVVKDFLTHKSLADTKKRVPQVISVEDCLEKTWIFWKEFKNLVVTLNSNETVSPLLENASVLFKQTLIEAGIHVI